MLNRGLLLFGLLLTGSPAVAEDPVVAVDTLKGESLRGVLSSLTDAQLVLQTEQGPREILVSELLAVRPDAAAAARSADGEVRLADGTRLAAANYTSGATSARFEHPRYGELTVPLDRVTSARLLAAEGNSVAIWTQLLERPLKKDLLAIKKAEVVDHLDGVVGSVDDKTVRFVLDGEDVPVKRERVFGLIYFRRDGAPSPTIAATIDTIDGDRLSAGKVTWADGRWRVELPGGIPLEAETGVFRTLDFSLGKVLYLSEVDPRNVEHVSWWDEPWVNFTYRRNRNFDGKPLRLAGKTWPRGLAIHSLTTLTYRLGGDYRRFVALAGIDDEIRAHGNVLLTISGDDKTLYEGEIGVENPRRPAIPLDLDVTGVVELKIKVDFGKNNDIGDRLHLVDARVTK
ncbi:MAG TPA: NPCBM/NEW2 domain-containing protein [Planctomycetaceae bacterium]|nr:NPCBM/NEW2 domain-containing protein [Planctomycetaceae bacterium]